MASKSVDNNHMNLCYPEEASSWRGEDKSSLKRKSTMCISYITLAEVISSFRKTSVSHLMAWLPGLQTGRGEPISVISDKEVRGDLILKGTKCITTMNTVHWTAEDSIHQQNRSNYNCSPLLPSGIHSCAVKCEGLVLAATVRRQRRRNLLLRGRYWRRYWGRRHRRVTMLRNGDDYTCLASID